MPFIWVTAAKIAEKGCKFANSNAKKRVPWNWEYPMLSPSEKHTLFQTKSAKKPSPSEPHIPLGVSPRITSSFLWAFMCIQSFATKSQAQWVFRARWTSVIVEWSQEHIEEITLLQLTETWLHSLSTRQHKPFLPAQPQKSRCSSVSQPWNGR